MGKMRFAFIGWLCGNLPGWTNFREKKKESAKKKIRLAGYSPNEAA